MKRGVCLFCIITLIASLFSCSSLGGFQAIGERDRIYSNLLSEYYLIGDAYLENKKYTKAIEYYTRALDHPDLSDSALYKIAYSYALAEQWDKSIHYYKELLEKDPDNSDLEKSLAYVYARQGNLAQSSAMYRKLTEKNPYDQILLENYITVLIAANYLEEAEKALYQFKIDFPDNTVAEDFDERLKKAWEAQEGKPKDESPEENGEGNEAEESGSESPEDSEGELTEETPLPDKTAPETTSPAPVA